jgi:hypothetical protein
MCNLVRCEDMFRPGLPASDGLKETDSGME